MDNFSTLAMDFGLRPQGKAAPMSRPSNGGDRPPVFDDVYTSANATSSFSDSLFKSSSSVTKNNNYSYNNNDNNYSNISSNRPSSPVYDKPVYDEDIFDGLPGVKAKSGSSRVSYDENVFATILGEKPNRNYSVEKKSDSGRVSFDENVFATMAKEGQNRNRNQSVGFDDLLENLGRSEKLGSNTNSNNNGMEGFDDLLPGFGVTSPQRSSRTESSQSKKASVNSVKPTSSVTDDNPFIVLESTSAPGNSSPKVFLDPLDEISKLSTSANTKANSSSAGGVVFDDIGPLDGFGNSAPSVSSEINKEDAPSRAESSDDTTQHTFRTEPTGKFQKMPDKNFQEFHENVFDVPNISTSSRNLGDQMASPSYVNVEINETNSDAEMSPGSDVHLDSSDDAWLTVSEIPLFTQPTSAPPPFRPPPPVPNRLETGIYHSNARKKKNEFSSSSSYSHYSQSPKPSRSSTVKSNMASPIDELENFSMGGTKHNNGKYTDTRGNEEVDANSSAAASAAAMKEAMDKAEAKFRRAKEVRGREHAKTFGNKEPTQVEKDEQVMPDEQEEEERLHRERLQREEEEERKRLERERERARVEREKARQAVERATREARERAAIEARDRAAAETRRKSEKSVVERVQAEARERATRAAVQRVQAEARERAAADAKEKAEKAAAEAKERENAQMRDKAAANAREAEARRRAERAAVDRAAAEARERAAFAARMSQQRNDNAKMNQQQRNDNDPESFFSVNSRPNSAPRPRANASDPVKVGSEGTNRTSSVNTSANLRKTSSATNFFDDLSSAFGGTSSSGDFQEVNGETEERRRARLDRHQRTQERAAKAVAEVNQRDLQSQRDQDERNRIGGTLDIEIKRWAAGKEGNLRALLSTMQYVLWPECGWTPVSLTDLITGASVKTVYRKAIVCVHPDKVQQKGANLQQKYIAEKVFDLLKEAWNKFNSEELF